VGRITKALPGELKRLLAWAGQWNPLAHALVVAFGLDLIADVFFGNADLNGAVFVVTFVAVLAASIVLQRRADTRRYDALPFSPGAPMDSDGVELELVAFAWTDPDRKEQKEMIWARPVDDDLFRIRSVPMVADGINRHDLVRCVEAEGRLHVAEVTERGGHRTVRFSANADLDLDVLRRLDPAAAVALVDAGDGVDVPGVVQPEVHDPRPGDLRALHLRQLGHALGELGGELARRSLLQRRGTERHVRGEVAVRRDLRALELDVVPRELTDLRGERLDGATRQRPLAALAGLRAA